MDTILIQPNTKIKYYKSKIYPYVPPVESDLYIITIDGDRLDTLSYRYYGDTSYWWVISTVNNNIDNCSLFPTPGTQLRIPLDLQRVLNIFDQANQ
jgi:phage tail protein X